MIKYAGGSFRDPSNRVDTVSDKTIAGEVRVLRGVDEETKANFETLSTQYFYKLLLQAQRLVQSHLMDVKEDEMVVKLLTNKKEQYDGYNIDTFVKQIEQLFTINSRDKLKNGKQEIFNLTPV